MKDFTTSKIMSRFNHSRGHRSYLEAAGQRVTLVWKINLPLCMREDYT